MSKFDQMVFSEFLIIHTCQRDKKKISVDKKKCRHKTEIGKTRHEKMTEKRGGNIGRVGSSLAECEMPGPNGQRFLFFSLISFWAG